jgi:folylpolyglutamate synthase
MASSISTAATAAQRAGTQRGSAEEYEEVLGRLSSLISQKVRAHTGNRGNQWDLMERYVQVRPLSPSFPRPSNPLLNPLLNRDGMCCI